MELKHVLRVMLFYFTWRLTRHHKKQSGLLHFLIHPILYELPYRFSAGTFVFRSASDE